MLLILVGCRRFVALMAAPAAAVVITDRAAPSAARVQAAVGLWAPSMCAELGDASFAFPILQHSPKKTARTVVHGLTKMLRSVKRS